MAQKPVATNLSVLNPTRVKPKAGDLFICNMRGKRWIAGRVVHLNCRMMTHDDGREPLLYFYRMEVTDPALLRPPFKPELLIPPIITNFLGWTHGYFKTIGNYPLTPAERLEQHYFKLVGFTPFDWDDPRAEYEDEFQLPTSRPQSTSYWRDSGLAGYRFIDDELSRALGIPAAPREAD